MTAFFLVSCVDIHENFSVLRSAYVRKVVIPPFYSGVIASYAAVYVASDEGSTVLLYPYLGETTILPSVGSHCSFKYRAVAIQGLKGERFIKRQMANIVIDFDCEGINGKESIEIKGPR